MRLELSTAIVTKVSASPNESLSNVRLPRISGNDKSDLIHSPTRPSTHLASAVDLSLHPVGVWPRWPCKLLSRYGVLDYRIIANCSLSCQIPQCSAATQLVLLTRALELADRERKSPDRESRSRINQPITV